MAEHGHLTLGYNQYYKLRSSLLRFNPTPPNRIEIHFHGWNSFQTLCESPAGNDLNALITHSRSLIAHRKRTFSAALFINPTNDTTLAADLLSGMLSDFWPDLDPEQHQEIRHLRDGIINRMIQRAQEVLQRSESWALVGEITKVTRLYSNREYLARLRSAAEDQVRMVPAAPHAVEEMLVAGKAVMEREEEQCRICLEEIPRGSEATTMPCSHSFHAPCIERWLKSSHYCPLCRFEMDTS